MRTLSVFVLFGIALMLTVVSNIGLWIDRTVYDTDTFVATTDDVLDDPDVQQVLADRFSAELYTAADVDERLQTELPEGLKFLALPLGTAAREFLRDASLRIVERQPFEDTRNRSLAEVHSRLIDAIEGESDAVSTEDDALVLDLQPVIERVAEDVTGRDVNVPREGGAEAEIPQDVLDRLPPDARARLEAGTDDRLLGRVELPDDAGRFVIEDRSVAWAYRIARYGNDVVYAAICVTLASYVLAVAFARDRRGAVRTSGIVLSAAGLISLALLLPQGGGIIRGRRVDGGVPDAVADPDRRRVGDRGGGGAVRKLGCRRLGAINAPEQSRRAVLPAVRACEDTPPARGWACRCSARAHRLARADNARVRNHVCAGGALHAHAVRGRKRGAMGGESA
jgi:hypothetical protein